MLKHINKILKLVGFNLVHAKKPKAKTVRAAKCIPSPTCCVNEYNAKTSCHVDASPTQDNNISGPTS